MVKVFLGAALSSLVAISSFASGSTCDFHKIAEDALKNDGNFTCDSSGATTCTLHTQSGYNYDSSLYAIPYTVQANNGNQNGYGNVLIQKTSCAVQYIQKSVSEETPILVLKAD